ncbi:hypothetical protein ACEPTV_33130, partial [Burkholderia pseudomallei]|uniref:hypothetical protein n=1 Tax=Burkholderia pseudomallei TaxID=28450 RepID=UPI00358F5AC7
NWDSVTKWIGEAWTNLMTGFQFIGGEVSRWWQEDFLGGIERGATWLAGKVLEVIGFFTSIPDKIGQAFQWVGDMLYKAAYSIASAIAWLWNNTVGKIDFTIPDWVPLIGGNHIHFPQIVVPALAAGGVVLGPTLALIGEAGPEAVVPLTEGGRYGFGGGSDRPIEVVVKLDGSVIARVVRKHNDRDDF